MMVIDEIGYKQYNQEKIRRGSGRVRERGRKREVKREIVRWYILMNF